MMYFVIRIDQFILILYLYYLLQERQSNQMIEKQSQIKMELERRYAQYFKWINSQQYVQQSILKYNSVQKEWQNYIPNFMSNYQEQNIQHLCTVSLNVLTDSTIQAPLKRNILFSPDRYKYILQQIKNINPHVVTFNQVTFNFNQLLLSTEWVRQKYWISFFEGEKQFDGSFNLIMTRICPVFLRKIKIQGLKRHILSVYLLINNQIKGKLYTNHLSISCAHLTSLTKNSKIRRQELIHLDKQLKTSSKGNFRVLNIIQGDLNIHQQKQNQIFRQLEWKDCWLEHYAKLNSIQYNKQEDILKLSPGYTFDGEINTLIKQVYWGFEARTMRLDRILYFQSNSDKDKDRQSSPLCQDIKIILNQPMYKDSNTNPQNYQRLGWIKGSLSLVSDIFGYNMFRQKQNYLFPSDHFGLCAQFQLTYPLKQDKMIKKI